MEPMLGIDLRDALVPLRGTPLQMRLTSEGSACSYVDDIAARA